MRRTSSKLPNCSADVLQSISDAESLLEAREAPHTVLKILKHALQIAALQGFDMKPCSSPQILEDNGPPLTPRLRPLLRPRSFQLSNPQQERNSPHPNQRRKHNINPLNRPPHPHRQPSLHPQCRNKNNNQTHIHHQRRSLNDPPHLGVRRRAQQEREDQAHEAVQGRALPDQRAVGKRNVGCDRGLGEHLEEAGGVGDGANDGEEED